MITATQIPATPWMYGLKGSEIQSLKEWAHKELVGFAWYGPERRYRVPAEMLQFLETYCAKKGIQLKVHRDPLAARPDITVATQGLHEYQHTGVERAIADGKGRWIFADDTGLGKTPQALVTARILGCRRLLIVGPSIAKQTWKDEILKWWPDLAPSAHIISTGRNVKNLSKPAAARLEAAYTADVQIISYGLLENITAAGYDGVILDECHALKNPQSQQTRQVERILSVQTHLRAVLGCSATLIPDKPVDVWGPINIIWPGRVGPKQRNGEPNFEFRQRYTNAEHTLYGWRYPGVNEFYKDELAWRLRGLSSRTTKAEVAHLLPRFLVSSLKVFEHSDRYRAVKDWVDNATETATHICVATKHRALASAYTEALGQHTKVTVLHVDGSMSQERRHNVIQAARELPAAILVCTMESVAESIDLTFCTEALACEILEYVKPMLQFCGRFARLSGRLPSSLRILILTARDQILAMKLEDKLAAINSLSKPGQAEAELECLTLSKDELDCLSDVGSASGISDELKELL